MMSCSNLAEAVQRLVQYCAVVSDAVDLRVTSVSGDCRIEVVPMESAIPSRSLRLDYTIVTFFAFCRWVTCRDVNPLGVELSYPAPSDLSLHQAAFSCTPHCNAPCHALVLRTEDLQFPLPTANTALSQLHDRVVQDHVRNLLPSSIEGRMTASLVRRIGSGRVTRSEIASELYMSERTLQRRLVEA